MTHTIAIAIAFAIFAFLVGGLPYVTIRGRRRRARQMDEPTFDDDLDPVDLDDDR